MHCSTVRREVAGLGEVGTSDHERKLVECCGEGQPGTRIHPELIVPSPQVLDEGVPSDAGGPVPFETPHRAKSGLIGFDAVVGVLGGVVKCIRQELCNDSDQGMGPIGGDLGRLAMDSDHRSEEFLSLIHI